ncbi:MAG: regulatory protein RecX [Limnochordia bacterium]|jgi:regulatory protein|nr:regulatory protein RecX [Bacillota bacterium]
MEQSQKDALEKAFRYLTYRDRTRGEMTAYLAKKGYSEEVIADTLQRLTSLGYIDDRRFVRQWIAWRRRGNGYHRLRQDLLAKGVERRIVDEEMADLSPQDEQEYAIARDLAQKRMLRYQGDAPEATARKLAAYLARRGFAFGIISQVVRELMGGPLA